MPRRCRPDGAAHFIRSFYSTTRQKFRPRTSFEMGTGKRTFAWVRHSMAAEMVLHPPFILTGVFGYVPPHTEPAPRAAEAEAPPLRQSPTLACAACQTDEPPPVAAQPLEPAIPSDASRSVQRPRSRSQRHKRRLMRRRRRHGDDDDDGLRYVGESSDEAWERAHLHGNDDDPRRHDASSSGSTSSSGWEVDAFAKEARSAGDAVVPLARTACVDRSQPKSSSTYDANSDDELLAQLSQATTSVQHTEKTSTGLNGGNFQWANSEGDEPQRPSPARSSPPMVVYSDATAAEEMFGVVPVIELAEFVL